MSEVETSVFAYFDGSVRKGNGGIGYVIKDLQGNTIYEGHSKVRTEDSMVAEALALKHAVGYVENNLDASVIYIKGDNREIVKAVDPQSPIEINNDTVQEILRKVKHQLEEFELVSYSKVPNREMNDRAHNLSRKLV